MGEGPAGVGAAGVGLDADDGVGEEAGVSDGAGEGAEHGTSGPGGGDGDVGPCGTSAVVFG